MTTTPEQLQAWQEKFCTAFNIRLWELPPSGNFSSLGLGREWAGYLRCCQENEQAIKDSYTQALEDVAEGFIKQKSWTRDYAYAVVQHAAEEGATK